MKKKAPEIKECGIRPPLREIQMNGKNSTERSMNILESSKGDISFEKEFSENCCSKDFLSFKDNTLKSFEYVENESICRKLKKLLKKQT